MSDTVENLIPRKIPENIEPLLQRMATILEDVADFGAQLIIWDSKPGNTGEENIAPVMLLRHFVELIDSISVLIRHSCSDPAKLQIRAAYETLLQILYLFDADAAQKSIDFLFMEVISDIGNLKKRNNSTPEGHELEKVILAEGYLKPVSQTSKARVADSIAQREKGLQKPLYDNSWKHYKALLKKKPYPKWHEFSGGPASIKMLSKHVKLHSDYLTMYNKWSGAVHGSNISLRRLLKNNSGGVDIVQIRLPDDAQEIVQIAISYSIKVYKSYIDNRVLERKDDFKEWYKSIYPEYKIISTELLIKINS